MEAIMSQALEIVKAQATTKSMTAEEIAHMISVVTRSISSMELGPVAHEESKPIDFDEAKRAIREKSVICMECGKSFKVLTKRHLATHGLTSDQYREKYGYKRGTALVAKSLARDRRTKMQDMRLWERRGGVKIDRPANLPAKRNPAQEEVQ